MKTKAWFFTLAVLLATATVCVAADDAHMGTWKLNEAKSKIGAGAIKNTTVVYEASGDSVKVTVDGVGSDGKDSPVTGDSTTDTRAYTKVDDHTLTMINKKDGKATITGRITVSADGKTRTVTTSGTNAKGEKVKTTAV